MHELGITLEIVEAVVRRAAGRKVHRVRVEVGRLTAVVPSALRFCFDVCAADAGIEGAELVVDEVAGVARCRACDAEIRTDVPYGECSCGGIDLAWIAGHELRIVEMEVS
jgi:hydrogenase nickel incorporation protein HypA/HybF